LRFALDVSAVTVSHSKGSGVNSMTASDPHFTVYLVVSRARASLQRQISRQSRSTSMAPIAAMCRGDMLVRAFMPPPFQVAPSNRENADLFGRSRAAHPSPKPREATYDVANGVRQAVIKR
jgi:hypothetical protein